MSKQLIIVGASAFAEIAREYFDSDTDYKVVAFAIETDFLKDQELNGLPIVPLESIEKQYPPDKYNVFVAITYSQLNRLRTRLTATLKMKGYKLASYISPRAFIWSNVKFGEHCFVFENNTLQPFVNIGNNVVLWSGNHIGHHSTIKDNCFISSQVVISGFCDIGENSFLGVNCTIANNVKVGVDNWIGPGVTISHETATGSLFNIPATEKSRVSTLRFFKIKDVL